MFPLFATSSKDQHFRVCTERNLSGWSLSVLPVKSSETQRLSKCFDLLATSASSLRACLLSLRWTGGEYILCPLKPITWSSWFHNWTQTSRCSASSQSCLCRLSWSLWSLQPGERYQWNTRLEERQRYTDASTICFPYARFYPAYQPYEIQYLHTRWCTCGVSKNISLSSTVIL